MMSIFNFKRVNSKFAEMKMLTKLRYFSSLISLSLMILSLSVIAVKGFNWGLDFTGGVVTEVRLDSKVASKDISDLLSLASE